MNTKTEFDFHPDAESLSAFAERVLTKEEHGEITAHLANCERCRQVVFLSQEAAWQEEDLAAVSVEKTGTARKSWLSDLVFVSASIAMAVVLALYVHVKHRARSLEMTKSAQQISPLAMARTGADRSTTTEVSQASGIAKGRVGAAPNQPPITRTRHFGSAELGGKGRVGNTGAEHLASPQGSIDARLPAPGSVNEFRPPPVDTAGTSAPTSAEVMTQEQSSVKDAKRSQAGTQEQGYEPKIKGASQALVETFPPAVGFAAGIRTTRAAALNAPKVSALPTGLPTISTVKGARATLAIDETGNVFVSSDYGSHWDSVARQWTGRAVTVRAQAGTPDNYELVNDRGQKWASPDGLVWTAE